MKIFQGPFLKSEFFFIVFCAAIFAKTKNWWKPYSYKKIINFKINLNSKKKKKKLKELKRLICIQYN